MTFWKWRGFTCHCDRWAKRFSDPAQFNEIASSLRFSQ
jgi:hypothetical protein